MIGLHNILLVAGCLMRGQCCRSVVLRALGTVAATSLWLKVAERCAMSETVVDILETSTVDGERIPVILESLILEP